MDFGFLTLAAYSGLGFQAYGRLMQVYGSHEACLRAGLADWRRKACVDARVAAPDFDVPKVIEQWLSQSDARLVTLWDADYPQSLKHLHSPPLMLFVKGDVQLLTSFQLAVVGSRAATALAQKATDVLIEPLARAGWTITSGLALGVDAWAHQAALRVGGKTLAVLGGGLNQIYPKSNRLLAQEILQQGGAWVSEQWPDTPAKPIYFPMRNRIVSGLSEGVLVVEAAARSGSLITAQMANEQGKPVMAVPASLFNAKGAGCLDLLADGAHLVRQSQDIALILESRLAQRLDLPRLVKDLRDEPQALEKPLAWTRAEASLMQCLDDQPWHPNQLAERLDWEVGQVNEVLMDLVDKAALAWVAGGRIQRLCV